MNVVTYELLAKVIKVKEKMDKMLKKYPIIDLLEQYTERYIADDNRDATAFLSINKHAKILKSPFLIYDKSKSAVAQMPNPTNYFIPNAQAIPSEKTTRGLVARDKRVKIGKYYKVKRIVLYVDLELDYNSIAVWLGNVSNNVIPVIQHEWVHIEQILRSKGLKDDADEGIDVSNPELTTDDLAKMSKHQEALMQARDIPFLKNLLLNSVNLIQKQFDKGDISEADIIAFTGNPNVKEALVMAAQQTVGGVEYQARKSEIGAYAVQAAEQFVRGEIMLLTELLSTYITMSIDSPKIKKKFFRLYSEALQERGVSNAMISAHVNQTYTNVKNTIMQTRQQVEAYMNT
jgi:hypothetical protein